MEQSSHLHQKRQLKFLGEMGFERERVLKILKKCQNDADAAAEKLVSGSG